MNPKPIHGEAVPFHIQHGYSDKSPVPCDFKLGDKVIFTNDAGGQFTATVRGFCKEIGNVLPKRFVYVFPDNSSWWLPVSPETLKHA